MSSYCTPEASRCYKSIPKEIYSCNISCNGLYADVRIEKEGKMNESSDFISIVGEYLKYKENYVQNIEFNSGFINKSFGEFNKIIIR